MINKAYSYRNRSCTPSSPWAGAPAAEADRRKSTHAATRSQASVPPSTGAPPISLCGTYASRVHYPHSARSLPVEGHVLINSQDGENWAGTLHWRFTDSDNKKESHTSYMTGVTTADQGIRFSHVSDMIDSKYGQGTSGFALVEIEQTGGNPLLLFNGISGDSFRAKLKSCPQQGA